MSPKHYVVGTALLALCGAGCGAGQSGQTGSGGATATGGIGGGPNAGTGGMTGVAGSSGSGGSSSGGSSSGGSSSGGSSSGGSSSGGSSSGGSSSGGKAGSGGVGGGMSSGTAGASATGGMTGSGGALSTGGTSGGGGTTCTPAQGVGGASTTCTPPTPPSAKDSVTLDMALGQGAPKYQGSGFIYGISEDGTQPPTALLSDIKVRAFRAGRGVTGNCGQTAWDTHWKVIKSYYAKAKELGVPLLILVSDDYQYSCPLPGDGGDWTTFTTFMGHLIDNVKANGMTGPDVRWELWNEADYSGFWKGTQAQWLDTWKHAYQQVRAAMGSAEMR